MPCSLERAYYRDLVKRRSIAEAGVFLVEVRTIQKATCQLRRPRATLHSLNLNVRLLLKSRGHVCINYVHQTIPETLNTIKEASLAACCSQDNTTLGDSSQREG